METPKPAKHTFVFFIVIGLGLSVVAYFWIQKTFEFTSTGVVTSGEIVEMVENRTDEEITYAPRVVFTTENNEEIKFISDVYGHRGQYNIGQDVEVIYSPDQPYNAEINSLFNIWLAPAIFAFFGAVFLLTGFVYLLTTLFRKKESDAQ